MSDKKNSKKKNHFDTSPTETSSKSADSELQHRFGAVAFIEDIAEDDEDAEILSLDSLRNALNALSDLPKKEQMNKESIDKESEIEKPVIGDKLGDEGVMTEEPEFPVTPPIESKTDEAQTIALTPRTILEAMLFIGDRNNLPLNTSRAAEKMRNVEPEEIDRIVAELNRDYDKLGSPYTIMKEINGYRMVLRTEFEPVLTRFYGKIREARLSQQAIDILAVVAYRQPLTADEVQTLRKQPSLTLLNQLVRRGLLKTKQQVHEKKKTVLYQTTERFLELFQLDSIDDLPTSEEIDFR